MTGLLKNLFIYSDSFLYILGRYGNIHRPAFNGTDCADVALDLVKLKSKVKVEIKWVRPKPACEWLASRAFGCERRETTKWSTLGNLEGPDSESNKGTISGYVEETGCGVQQHLPTSMLAPAYWLARLLNWQCTAKWLKAQASATQCKAALSGFATLTRTFLLYCHSFTFFRLKVERSGSYCTVV